MWALHQIFSRSFADGLSIDYSIDYIGLWDLGMILAFGIVRCYVGCGH